VDPNINKSKAIYILFSYKAKLVYTFCLVLLVDKSDIGLTRYTSIVLSN